MNIYKKITELLDEKVSFAVATIIKSHGSTPRTSGSRMVVRKDRSITGTIGGGIVEAEVINKAVALMDRKISSLVEFELNNDLKGSLDMVCGGTLTVLIDVFTEDDGTLSYNKKLYEKALFLQGKGERAVIVSKVNGNIDEEFETEKYLVSDSGVIEGKSIVPKPIIEKFHNDEFNGSDTFLFNYNLELYFIENVERVETLYIFGGGHVGYKLAQIAHITGFKVVITDDREEFSNSERFPFAHVRVIEEYRDCLQNLPINKNSYLVILTRGHMYDQNVLEQCLNTDPAYIGMIGSIVKRDTIYNNLLNKGISRESIDKVYSPVGIKIGSETPAEIAVSIIAEIIKIKSEK